MSSRVNIPDLKKFMDKHVSLQLNANRKVSGILRGYDPFMNVVLDETVEESSALELPPSLGRTVIRGNSIVMIDVLSTNQTQ